MKRLGVLLGSLAFAQLGCETIFDYGGEERREPAKEVPAEAAPATPPAPAPVVSAAATPPAPAPSASAEAPGGPLLLLSPGAEASGIMLNQLRVVPPPPPGPVVLFPKPKPKKPAWHEVTVYAVFRAAFPRRLELRAVDADHQELGRTEREVALNQPADTAGFVTLRLDPRVPLDQVKAYVAYVDPSPEPEADEEPPVPPKPAPTAVKPPRPTPAPAEPQPEYLAPKQSGLVPKDP